MTGGLKRYKSARPVRLALLDADSKVVNMVNHHVASKITSKSGNRMSIPSCRDCKHFSAAYGPDRCEKFTEQAEPGMWAYGVDRVRLSVSAARQGVCGREGKAFERRPTIWMRLRSLLSTVTSGKK